MNNNTGFLGVICVRAGIFAAGMAFGILCLPNPTGAAEPVTDSVIQMADSQAQPGSKSPEGLEPTPPASFTVGWDITLASKYLFQGIDYSDGKPVVQPEVTLAVKNFSAILWFNHDLDIRKSNEFDLYLQYGLEIQDLSLTAGYAHYNYPHREGWDPSQEVFVDFSYSAPLNPSLSIHYDFDAGKGTYATLGISREKETFLGTLSGGMNLFYQNNYYDATGFPSMEFNVSNGYPIGSLTLTPSVSYFMTWDNGDFQGDGAVSDTWLFSINISQSF